MTRKEAREQAFLLVFESGFKADTANELFEAAFEARDLEPDEYIKSTVNGVISKISEIDEKISANAKGWNINRISKVTLAALRLAIYEMLFEDEIPVSVAINEAIELIKKYASKEDASYANGVLGTIASEAERE